MSSPRAVDMAPGRFERMSGRGYLSRRTLREEQLFYELDLSAELAEKA